MSQGSAPQCGTASHRLSPRISYLRDRSQGTCITQILRVFVGHTFETLFPQASEIEDTHLAQTLAGVVLVLAGEYSEHFQ